MSRSLWRPEASCHPTSHSHPSASSVSITIGLAPVSRAKIIDGARSTFSDELQNFATKDTAFRVQIALWKRDHIGHSDLPLSLLAVRSRATNQRSLFGPTMLSPKLC